MIATSVLRVMQALLLLGGLAGLLLAVTVVTLSGLLAGLDRAGRAVAARRTGRRGDGP
jgi:hypothetical protein